MPKTLNDIIPPSRRKQMEIGEQAPTMSAPRAPEAPMTPTPPPPPPQAPMRAPRPRAKFPYGTALIALIVVALSAATLYAFSGAKVEVTPATNDVYIAGDFTATASGGELPFEVVTIEKTAVKSVPAESTEEKNDPASGTITIYNTQSSAQPLIKNTRFQTKEGLIFRIRESVTVPAGAANAPGTVNVTVYADEGGDRYNVGPSDFTVPGLSGSAAFSQVYAKSTGPMAGGFSGTRPTVSESTIEAQTTALQTELQNQLTEEAKTKIPEGYILVPGAYTITYEPQPDTPGQGNNVDVKMKGTMTAVVFPNQALAKAVAYQVVGTYSGQPVELQKTDALKITPASSDSPVAAQTYAFNLTGNARVVWKIDEARIAGAVAGKTRDGAQVVLSGFPEVDKALLVLRPFWSSSFPQDPDKIKVSVKEVAGE